MSVHGSRITDTWQDFFPPEQKKNISIQRMNIFQFESQRKVINLNVAVITKQSKIPFIFSHVVVRILGAQCTGEPRTSEKGKITS